MKYAKLAIISCIALCSWGNVYAQKTLEQQMWDFSGYDSDERKEMSEDLTEDIKNGYISYSGGGGNRAFDMAAFRDNDGSYTLIKQEETDPSTPHIQMKPDKTQQLHNVLNIKQFISNYDKITKYQDNSTLGYAPFYYRFELPRHGTDIPVSLELELLNYRRNAPGFVALSEESYKTSIDKIQVIAKKIDNIETMELIRKGQFDRIPSNEQKLIKSIIEDRQWYKKLQLHRWLDDKTDGITSIAELTHELNKLYLLYQLSRNIDRKVILGWNKQTAQFYVKKINPIAADEDFHNSFDVFLKGYDSPDDYSPPDEAYNNPTLYNEKLVD